MKTQGFIHMVQYVNTVHNYEVYANWCDRGYIVNICYCNDVNKTPLPWNFPVCFNDPSSWDLRPQHTIPTVHLGKAFQLYLAICLPCTKKVLPLARDGIWSSSTGNDVGKQEIRTLCCPALHPSRAFSTQDTHLFPLSVLVQHNHHQPGVHLVAFLSEGQVFAIPCHIDHKSRKRKRERQGF